MATKKKTAKKKATKKKPAKKKATKKKAAKKKPAKKKAAKKKPAKKKAAKKKPAKKKPNAPTWLQELKRGDRFRELIPPQQIAIYCGYERDGAGYALRMKDTGKNPLTFKIGSPLLAKFYKPIVSREPASGAKKSNGNGSTARERAIMAWLK